MKARRVSGLDPDGPLADNVQRIALVRLDELCSFMPQAADARETVALHDMRIAAKRLRYVLEVTHEVFGPYAAKAVEVVKDLQDLLGEIHDCDVQLPEVGDVLPASSARACTSRRGAICCSTASSAPGGSFSAMASAPGWSSR
jgi:CHAD domain-containing protein